MRANLILTSQDIRFYPIVLIFPLASTKAFARPDHYSFVVAVAPWQICKVLALSDFCLFVLSCDLAQTKCDVRVVD